MGNKKGKPKAPPGGQPNVQANAPPAKLKKLKILLIGDITVGKSSLLLRYTENQFSEAAVSSISADGDSKLKEVFVKDANVKVNLEIWDTGGQERFRTITSSFYAGANGVIILYDITNPDSWNGVQKWTVETDRYAPSAVKLLVGNKLDLATKDRVDQIAQDTGREFGQQNDITFLEVSSKDPNLGDTVAAVFETIAAAILEAEDD